VSFARAHVLAGLVQAGREMGVALSLETTLKVSVESAVRLTSARAGVIVLLGREERVSHSSAWSAEGGEGPHLAGLPEPGDLLAEVLAGRVPDSAVVRTEYRQAHAATPLPLLAGVIELHGEVLGVLCLVGRPGEAGFTIDDEIALESFIQHTTLSIANACLQWRAEERADKLAVLGRLTRFLTSTTDSARIYKAIARVAAILLEARAARVWVADPGKPVLRIGGSFGVDSAVEAAMTDRMSIEFGEGVVGSVAASRTPEFLTDVQQDLRWLNTRFVKDAAFHGFACLPLMVEHRVLGALSIFFGHRGEFSGEERELLGLLADQAAIAIENARLFQESERRREEAEVLAAIVRTLNQSLRLDTVLHSVTEAARSLCRSDLARIALEEPGTGGFRFRYSVGARVRRLPPPLVFPGHGLGGLVLNTGAPVRSDRLKDDPRVDHRFDPLIDAEGLLTTLVVPIRVGSDVEGVIFVDNRTAQAFTDADEAVLVRLAEHAAIAIRNARLFEEASRRRRVADGLVDLARVLTGASSGPEVAQRVRDAVGEMLAGSAEVFRLDASGVPHRLDAADETPGRDGDDEHRRLLEVALEERRATAGGSHRGADGRPQPWAQPSILCVPLVLHERPLGALLVTADAGRGFGPHEIHVVEAVAGQAALALSNTD
jgi:GAF domain-containing protein